METTLDTKVEQLVERLRAGRLTEAELREALDRSGAAQRQDLLYLQTSSTALTSSVLGMTRVLGGEIVNTRDWPYANVLEALRDGWRVIKFPELALLMVDSQTVGLGCEFVLEKWS